MTDALTRAIQASLETEDDIELAEATDLCALVGIPAEYAPNLAAAIAVCAEAGA